MEWKKRAIQIEIRQAGIAKRKNLMKIPRGNYTQRRRRRQEDSNQENKTNTHTKNYPHAQENKKFEFNCFPKWTQEKRFPEVVDQRQLAI